MGLIHAAAFRKRALTPFLGGAAASQDMSAHIGVRFRRGIMETISGSGKEDPRSNTFL